MEPELEPLEGAIKSLKARDAVLREMMATCSIEANHRHFPPALREFIDIWRTRLKLDALEWKPYEPPACPNCARLEEAIEKAEYAGVEVPDDLPSSVYRCFSLGAQAAYRAMMAALRPAGERGGER